MIGLRAVYYFHDRTDGCLLFSSLDCGVFSVFLMELRGLFYFYDWTTVFSIFMIGLSVV